MKLPVQLSQSNRHHTFAGHRQSSRRCTHNSLKYRRPRVCVAACHRRQRRRRQFDFRSPVAYTRSVASRRTSHKTSQESGLRRRGVRSDIIGLRSHAIHGDTESQRATMPTSFGLGAGQLGTKTTRPPTIGYAQCSVINACWRMCDYTAKVSRS